MKLLLILLFICSITYCFSQNSNCDRRPDWTANLPQNEHEYLYVAARGSGKTLEEAENNALSSLIREIAMKGNCEISTSSSNIRDMITEINRATETNHVNTVVLSACEKLKTQYEITKKYGCKDDYWLLAKVKTINLKKALIFSILPSAGQFYKSNKVLGGVVVASVGAFGVSSAWAFSSSNDINKQIAYARTTPEITQLENDRDNRRTLGFTLLAAGIATYTFSIIHAGTYKSSKRLYSSTYERFDFAPFLASNSAGISVKFNLN